MTEKEMLEILSYQTLFLLAADYLESNRLPDNYEVGIDKAALVHEVKRMMDACSAPMG